MIKITDDMKQRIERALEEKKYCVWATTSQEGYPDLSFRGSTFVYDDEHLAFWDRSLGQSTANLERNPHVCMLYHDQPGRTGWRFFATFVFFVCSFEKDLRGCYCSMDSFWSVIPVKTGIQANPAVNEPGFPRARE